MKLKNLAFFGVMASILSVASAQAAEGDNYIASKGYVDNKVGTVSTNLGNNYYTKNAVDTELAKKANSADLGALATKSTVAKTDLASDVQTSLGLADSAVQSVKSGTANGTIAVDGEDVAVTGLGTAAYQASTAFDAAGAATAAQTAAQNYTDTQLANYTPAANLGALASKNTVGTDDIDAGAVTAEKLATAVQTTINGAVQSVESGAANGTIAVDGTDVAVTGLGTAAYTASTAYDAAGAANTAEQNAKDYADTELAKKQDTITDLTTIRSGAAAGATALQPTSELDGSKLTAGSVAKTALATAVQNAIDSALVKNEAITGSSANSIVQYDAKGLVVSGTAAGTLATVSPETNTCPAGRTCVVTKDSSGNHHYTPVTLDNEQ